MDVIRNRDTKVRIQGHNRNNLKFADDIDIVDEDIQKYTTCLQENMNEVRKAEEAAIASLKINVGKTKAIVTGKENIEEQIELKDIKIENVTEFTYQLRKLVNIWQWLQQGTRKKDRKSNRSPIRDQEHLEKQKH